MLWYGSGLGKSLGLDLPTDAITPGLLVAFIDYIDRLFRPLRDASGKIAILQRASAALVKIFDLLGADERLPDGDQPLVNPAGNVVLRDVRFRRALPWLLGILAYASGLLVSTARTADTRARSPWTGWSSLAFASPTCAGT